MEAHDTRHYNLLNEKVKDYLARIDEAIKGELDKYRRSRFYGPLAYAVEGGKRIRPLILLLSCEAVGGKGDDPLPAAMAVELLHTESIIHDDIIDQELSRRERMAFYVKYGYAASLLSADFVFGVILEIASRYRNPAVARELSTAALHMCEGEFWELKIDPQLHHLNRDEYVRIITLKTASLFHTAAKLGGMIGEGTEEQTSALSSYGLNLGVAYQLHDDVLDWGEEGKITGALNFNRRRADTLNSLKKMATMYANQAKDALRTLEGSSAKECLSQLADFTVLRSF